MRFGLVEPRERAGEKAQTFGLIRPSRRGMITGSSTFSLDPLTGRLKEGYKDESGPLVQRITLQKTYGLFPALCDP